MSNKVLIHKNICNELSKLYEQKNADYGDAFAKSYDEYGEIMPIIRIEDKLNRLKSLTINKRTQQVSNESINDTLMDIANYAIMTIIEREQYRGTEEK